MRGFHVRNVYVAVVGTDLIRMPAGEFVVLEDNLRVPSGVSYMLVSREVMKRLFPICSAQACSPSSTIARLLTQHAALAVARRTAEPTIVLLTPGVFNSAYFEHAFLARQMGIELVEGRDLVVHDNFVYMRTSAGLRRVDVIYRRIDDDFIDPLAFRPIQSGRSRLVQRVSRRQREHGERARHAAWPTIRPSTRTFPPSSSTT